MIIKIIEEKPWTEFEVNFYVLINYLELERLEVS
jgi:hypothetical protein